MTYFVLDPEAAGGFGPATTGDLRARPPLLEKFNYEFDVWLGDPLLEAVSTFIVTDRFRETSIGSSPPNDRNRCQAWNASANCCTLEACRVEPHAPNLNLAGKTRVMKNVSVSR
jgi:hypothetical protein